MRKKRFFRRAVYEFPEQLYVPERNPKLFRQWLSEQQGDKPLHMEIGMGCGDFLVASAAQHPESFFLGVEIKPDRIYRGLEKAQALGLKNIAFLQTPVERLPEYTLPACDRLIMLFPDPWPKDRHEHRRMTSPGFLKRYRSFLKQGGDFYFKTDNEALFRYSHDTLLQKKWRVHYVDENHHTPEPLRTAYEERYRHAGKPIYHLKALQPRHPFPFAKFF